MPKYSKKMMVIAAALVILFIVCGIGFNLIFRFISYSFYKNAKPYTDADATVSKLEMGTNGDLIGYARSTDFSQPKKTIIYFGGSGEIAYNAVMDFRSIFPDYTFISVDYPGSQESKGKMNLSSMQQAATTLYDYVVNLDYVDKDHVYVIGYSYGTGIATYLASQRECAKLVLLAPYRDVKDLYNAIIPVFHTPLGWFVTDNIDTKKYAKNVSEPTLIVTSVADTKINSSIPVALAKYFSNQTLVQVDGVDHPDYWKSNDVRLEVNAFLCK